MQFSPRLNLDLRDPFGMAGWNLGLVAGPAAGELPGVQEGRQGGRVGQPLLAVRRGVHQCGRGRQRHLGVMGKQHVTPDSVSVLLSGAYVR